MLNQENTRKQGEVGLGVAIGWFTTNGYIVSIPLADNQGYDLVVDNDGTLKKVQVKTSRYKDKRGAQFVVTLATSGGNRSGTGRVKPFEGSTVDFLFILTGDGSKYLIPGAEMKATRSTTLGPKYQKFRVE